MPEGLPWHFLRRRCVAGELLQLLCIWKRLYSIFVLARSFHRLYQWKYSKWTVFFSFQGLKNCSSMFSCLHSLLFLRLYLFIHERRTERGRDIGRGRSRCPAGSPMWDSISGPWDHILARRQALNPWAPQGPLFLFFFFLRSYFFNSWETQGDRSRDTGREKQTPCREPDVGFDPRTPGSRPG